MPSTNATRTTLAVLASTYPRWRGDVEPGFVHELSRQLTDRFDVVAIVPSSPDAPDREMLDRVDVVRFRYAPRRLQTLVNHGGIVTNLRRSPWKWLLVPSFILMQWLTAWRVLRGRSRVVIHAHWIIPQGVIAAFLAYRFVVTSHGADLFTLKGALPVSIKRWVLKRANVLTVVSSAMREAAASMQETVADIPVVPMGVDLDALFTPDHNVERSLHEILFVGRLVEKKGVDILIQAMAMLREEVPDARLSIAGFGPEEPALRDQVRRLGLEDRIRFLGAVPQKDLPALYRRAAVFAAPFRQAGSGDQEGLGLVLVEALGCGCPVVCADVPGTRDVVADIAGTLQVPPEQPRELAAALRTILNDPGRFAIEAGIVRATLGARFGWTAVADRYAAILSEVASEAGTGRERG